MQKAHPNTIEKNTIIMQGLLFELKFTGSF